MRKWIVFLVVVLAVVGCGGSSYSAAPAVPLSPVEFSGKGDDVLDVSSITGKAYTRATLTHDGTKNFIVRPLQPDGSDMMSLVNEIGAYSGTVTWDKRAGSISVRADGNWTIVIK